MGAIQDKNTKNLTEVEEIKKMCKNTQNNYIRKVKMTWIITKMWSLT